MQTSDINSRPMLLLGITSVASPAQSAPKDEETQFHCKEQAALAQGTQSRFSRLTRRSLESCP